MRWNYPQPNVQVQSKSPAESEAATNPTTRFLPCFGRPARRQACPYPPQSRRPMNAARVLIAPLPAMSQLPHLLASQSQWGRTLEYRSARCLMLDERCTFNISGQSGTRAVVASPGRPSRVVLCILSATARSFSRQLRARRWGYKKNSRPNIHSPSTTDGWMPICPSSPRFLLIDTAAGVQERFLHQDITEFAITPSLLYILYLKFRRSLLVARRCRRRAQCRDVSLFTKHPHPRRILSLSRPPSCRPPTWDNWDMPAMPDFCYEGVSCQASDNQACIQCGAWPSLMGSDATSLGRVDITTELLNTRSMMSSPLLDLSRTIQVVEHSRRKRYALCL